MPENDGIDIDLRKQVHPGLPERPATTDLTYKQAMHDLEYTAVLSPEDIQKELDVDPTVPEEAKTPGRRAGQKSLSKQQQLQLAVWIVDGYTYPEAQRFMMRDWGFSITKATWTYYRHSRPDLIKAAGSFLADQYLKTGYANRPVMFHKLAKHADMLHRTIEEKGLFKAEVHVIGFGKNSKTVASEVFDAQLSKEYRETLKQMDSILDKVDPILKPHQQAATIELTEELAGRFAAVAEALKPKQVE